MVTGFQGILNPNQISTIALGAQESSAIPCGGFTLCGIKVPAAFTGVALTFEMCDTLSGTYVPIRSGIAGTVLTYTVVAGAYFAIDPKDFYGINFLKIKSGSAEAAARSLICALKGF